MSGRLKGKDGKTTTLFLRPPRLDQISKKTKGSDGIERTLSEWWEHIAEKSVYADGDDPIDMKRLSLQNALDQTITAGVDTKKALEAFSHSAGEYIKEAFIESIDKVKLLESRDVEADKECIVKEMEKRVRSLAGSLGNTKWKKQGRAALGQCLLFYIEHHSALPKTRSDLQEFSRELWLGELPLSTMADHLPWYGLEKVCRTYHKE